MLCNCRIRALRHLARLLDAARADDLRLLLLVTRLDLLQWHLKLAEGRLRELLFDLFLEVNKLQLYFRINVAPLLPQRTACICYNVTLGCAFFHSHVLLSFLLLQLADAIQIVALGQAILLPMRRRRSLLVQVLIAAVVVAILLICLFVAHLCLRLDNDLLLLLLVLSVWRVALVGWRVKLVPARRWKRHWGAVTLVSMRGWLRAARRRFDEILLMQVAASTIAVTHGLKSLLLARCRSLWASAGQFPATAIALLIH